MNALIAGILSNVLSSSIEEVDRERHSDHEQEAAADD